MHHLMLAYLDPGTGSIIVQSLIGAIAGIAYFGRHLFSRLLSTLRRKKDK
jgi:hypothetical protein